MKRIIIFSLLSATLWLGVSVNPILAATNNETKQTTNEVINAILKTELAPTYSESEAISSSGETMTYKTWDNSMNGQYSTEEKTTSQISYYANEGDKSLSYADGDSQAIQYNAGVKISPNDAKPIIKAMQQTTTISFVGKESMLNRQVYHLKGKGKTVTVKTHTRTGLQTRSHTYPDMELWVDTETGFIMKQKYGNASMGYSYDTVVKVAFNPTFTSSTFKLDLPKHVTVINADELLPKKK